MRFPIAATARGRLGTCVVALCLAVLAASPAAAQLERVGPTLPGFGYPAWYQDKTGVALEFCSPLNQAELDGGWCLILPADVPSGTAPETFPTPANFAEEHFYWSANAAIDYNLPGGGTSRALLVLGLEAAFGAGAATPGDQIVFGRVRIVIRNLPFSGTYTVYHPYGTVTFENQVAGDRLFFTDDIGINCPPGTFDCALASKIGPFLLPSLVPGGTELAPIAGPVPGKLYIADPARLGPVTGGVNNFFRIEGPNGFVIQTTDFALTGRVFTGTIPGRVTVDRASYATSAAGAPVKLDVFATGFPTRQGRIPAGPLPAATSPALTFYSAPCDVNPDTGAIGPPAGEAERQMSSSGINYWGQSQPASVPAQVCVADRNARDPNGQVIPAFFLARVTDDVTITQADYDPTTATLLLAAVSSDTVNAPTLTFGTTALTAGQLSISGLAAPPAKVTIRSSRDGSAEALVRTSVGASGALPVAVNDTATTAEDAPVTIDVLANDTFTAAPAVNIVTPPQLGAAVVNANGSITYTPNLNANGSDAIGYNITVNGQTSSTATVAITITPVNDPPVAVNDTASTAAGIATNLSLLANDTDPDGAADLRDAVIVTQPAGGATVTGGAGGTVVFTAPNPGTYTFTYRAQDAASALSANTATVTVTVSAAEVITVTLAEFRTSQGRLRVSGTDSVAAGQTLTITWADGTAAGTVLGVAGVDAGGNWLLDLRGVTGVLDPRTSGATRVRVTSPLGGNVTAPITIRR